MGLWTRLRALIAGRPSALPLAPRHDRREAARQRHHETGEPAWTESDRHPGPDGEHPVADVTPGTPGHFGSVRTGRDD
jgi:hypothetical protein